MSDNPLTSMRAFEKFLADLPGCPICGDMKRVHTHGGERDTPPSKEDLEPCPRCQAKGKTQ